MKKFISITGAALWAILWPMTVSAATIDFAEFAKDNEGGVQNGSIVSVNGINIYHLAGYDLETERGGLGIRGGGHGMDPFSSYYDDFSEGKRGGLGVCRVLAGDAGTTTPGAECLDPSDDSIDGEGGVNEAIFLHFIDGPLDIRHLSFRDGDHNDISNSDGLVEWGAGTEKGVFGGISTFAELVAMAIAGEFVGTQSFALGYVDTEFYLGAVSDVPIPGAIPILLSGLAGLGFFSRKKDSAK